MLSWAYTLHRKGCSLVVQDESNHYKGLACILRMTSSLYVKDHWHIPLMNIVCKKWLFRPYPSHWLFFLWWYTLPHSITYMNNRHDKAKLNLHCIWIFICKLVFIMNISISIKCTKPFIHILVCNLRWFSTSNSLLNTNNQQQQKSKKFTHKTSTNHLMLYILAGECKLWYCNDIKFWKLKKKVTRDFVIHS